MIYHEEMNTLADLASLQAQKFPDSSALVLDGEESSYSKLHVKSNQTAQALLQEGIQPQTRVGLVAKDCIRSFELLFACAKIGAVLVPVNWRLAQPEIAYILNDAEVQILFVGAEFIPLIEEIRDQLKQVKTIIFFQDTPQTHSYQEWQTPHPEEQPDISIAADQVVVQMYTSGTTGHPKGVQLAHSSFFAIAREYFKEKRPWIHWSEKDRNLNVIPFFHIGGLWWAIRGLASGAKNVLLPTFIGHEALKAIETYQITKTCMVPAMIQFLFREPECKNTDFSSLEYIVYGGSPIAEALLKEAMQTFSCQFLQIYGMTETGNMAVCLPASAHTSPKTELLKAAGKPHPGVSVKVVDQNGVSLPSPQIGEVLIHSPANMVGYWKLPEATKETLIDGWIHTGDAGYFDEEGYLYVCDRIKDMISYSGENVYPAEIESVLYEHPDIVEVAVIGVPDRNWGEVIKAVVVKQEGSNPTPREIMQFAKGKIADFKIPKSVSFVDSLPRTPSGKLQKAKIREPYWKDYQRKVN